MPDIDIFMKENPDFQGEDPNLVADFVFEDEYKAQGVSREEFDEFFLGHKPGVLAATGRAIKSGVDTVADAVKGDAEHPEMGNLQTIDAGNSLKVGMASTFGDDEDYTKAALEANPGSTLSKDKNGNPMLTLADGKQAYINKPGLDAEDVTRFAGKALSFVPSGAAVVKAAGKGLMARLGVAGVTAGATDAAMQKAAGREDIDESQVAMTAILGTAAETASVPLGAAAKWASQKFKNWQGMTPEKRGIVLAKRMKIDDLSPDQHKRLGEWDEAGELVDPQAVIANSEFGYRLTKGQSMPEGTAKERAAKFEQLSTEERLRTGSKSGERFRDVETGNAEHTERNIDEITGSLSGGTSQATDQFGAANKVSTSLQEAASTAKSGVDDAYARAREHPLDFDENWQGELHKNVKDRIKDTDLVIDKLTPAAKSALKAIKAEKRTSLEAIDRMRRVVSRAYDKAANGEDRRAVQMIKDSLDSEVDHAIQSGLFQGDGRAVLALKEARKLNTEYMKKFRSNDEAGKVVQKLLDPDVTSEQTAQYLIGVNGLTKAGASRVVRKYAEAVGKDSEAFNSLREMTFLTLVKKPTGELKGHQHLVSALRTAMNGKGQSMMNELFSPTELKKLQRFVNSVDKLVPQGSFARSSGTAERLARFYGSTFDNTPLLAMANKVMEHLGTNNALRIQGQTTPRLPVLEATGATAASN